MYHRQAFGFILHQFDSPGQWKIFWSLYIDRPEMTSEGSLIVPIFTKTKEIQETPLHIPGASVKRSLGRHIIQ